MIYKYPIEINDDDFYAPMEVVGFGYDGHNQLCIWCVESNLKIKYKVVGTGWTYHDNWSPTKLMTKSNGGFIWHLLKHK